MLWVWCCAVLLCCTVSVLLCSFSFHSFSNILRQFYSATSIAHIIIYLSTFIGIIPCICHENELTFTLGLKAVITNESLQCNSKNNWHKINACCYSNRKYCGKYRFLKTHEYICFCDLVYCYFVPVYVSRGGEELTWGNFFKINFWVWKSNI